MDQNLLIASCASFALALAAGIAGFARNRPWTTRANFAGIFLGFVFTSWYLYQRGQIEKSCPLNSLFDIFIFQSWSLVLIYLLVGTAYRLSLLGSFTAPLALVLQVIALLAPISREPVVRSVLNPWVEAHAALSMVAYGCFGLACIAGGMYLLQEHQLKARQFSPLMHGLPPINDLSVANRRLLLLGFTLLTAGFLAGFFSRMPVNTLKFWGSLAIWAAYGLVLFWNRMWPIPARRIALVSVVVFAAALFTLPAIQHLSARP